MPAGQRKRAILGLSQAEAEAILWDWEFWAREEQLEPEGDWFTWLLRSGRGFGKTRTGSETVNKWARLKVSKQILIAGRIAGDVRSLMIEGPSGILATSPPWFRPHYEPSKRQITWPNGVIGVIRYGDEPDGFRGFEGGRAWLDELFHWMKADAAYDNLILGMRELGDIRMLITSSPKPTKLCRDIAKESDTIDVKGSTFDNAVNLAPKYLAKIRKRFEGTRQGRQELYGEILSDNPAAQWKYETIAEHRVDAAPELERVVVGVDPAATYGEKSDETGIIVAGVGGRERHGYVIADHSLRAHPQEWATAVVRAFRKHRANLVVVETNNGGDMVEHTLRMVDDTIPIKRVHAKKAKRTRAEPVAALYEQGRVHHVGGPGCSHLDQESQVMHELEEQLCNIDLDAHDEHDDRLDALVYALTELMVDDGDVLGRLEALA